MTRIIAHIDVPGRYGDKPASGYMVWTPTARRYTDDTLTLPGAFTATLENGVAMFTATPNTAEWVWRVDEIFTHQPRNIMYVTVQGDQINYSDLSQVDPNTVAPNGRPSALWWEVANASIQDAKIINGELVLTRYGGETVNLGSIIGAQGRRGPRGIRPADGKDGVSPVVDYAAINAASQAFLASNPAVVQAAVAAVNATPTITALTEKSLQRGDIGAGGDITTLRGSAAVQGRYRITSTGVVGLPFPALGFLDVYYNGSDGRTTHEFKRSNVGTTQKFTNVYTGSATTGTWGGWKNDGWYRGLLTIGTNVFTLTDPGLWGIQSVIQPGLPAGFTGSFEILPSSAAYAYRYITSETVPTVWYWRAPAAEADPITGWTRTPKMSDIANLQGQIDTFAASATLSAPVRGELEARPVSVTSKVGTLIMSSMSKDRLRGWNSSTSALSETRDEGLTWTQLNTGTGLTTGANVNIFAGSTVESVRQLDNGELLITCLRGSSSRREIWVTTNLDNPVTRTFTRTDEARAEFIKYTSAWSQSDHGPIVLVNEYGPKTPTWTGANIAPGNNARFTRLSTDSGKTWKTIFDLNQYLTTVQGRTNTDNQHLHGVAWDPIWDTIWVTYGDNFGGAGCNGIVYSQDLGATWKTAHFYSGSTPPHQLVGIQPMPKCILFYGDLGPDVIRIDRSEGKYKEGGYTTTIAFNSKASGRHLCQGFTRIDRVGDDGPALAAWSSEGEPAPSFAMATLDGYTFAEIWRDTIPNPSGFGARSIVGPTIRGDVIISSNDQKVAGQWSEIRTKATGY